MLNRNAIIKGFKIILFVLLFCYIFIHLTYIFRSSLANTRDNITGFYAEKEESLDVVVLGTSSTFSAFMPMEAWERHGIASYNFCTNVLFENAMKYHVREIKKTQSPRLLIIDTAPFLYGHKSTIFMNEESHLRYNTDGFAFSQNRIDLINAIIGNQKEKWNYYFDLFYYHGNENPELDYWSWRKHNIGKGYSNLPFQANYMEPIVEQAEEVIPLPEDETAYLWELLAELSDFEGDVLFITQPFLGVESSKQAYGKANYIKKEVLAQGYDYLDLTGYTDEMQIEQAFDYSLDFLHFHAFSAEKITDFLTDYIVQQYDLPDHRTDAAYADWEADYAEWLVLKEKERDYIAEQRVERIRTCESINQYLSYLQSDYYSSCIYISNGETMTQNTEVRIALETLTGSKKIMSEEYFAIIDHSKEEITEGINGETITEGSTFGMVEFSVGEDAQRGLMINGTPIELDVGDAINAIVVEKATGEIIDKAVYRNGVLTHKNED